MRIILRSVLVTALALLFQACGPMGSSVTGQGEGFGSSAALNQSGRSSSSPAVTSSASTSAPASAPAVTAAPAPTASVAAAPLALPHDSSGKTLQSGGYYTIRSLGSGHCLDVTNGLTGDGVRLQEWTCLTQDINQEWKVQVNSDGSYSFVSVLTNRVVDFDANTLPADGTIVQDYQFLGGANQMFRLSASAAGGYQITSKAANASCLDVPTQTYFNNGSLLQVWDCTGALNQAFVFVPAQPTLDSNGNPLVKDAVYAIQNRGSGKCLDVTNGQTGNGVRLQQFDCLGNVNQQWRLQINVDSSSTLVSVLDGRVLDFDANTLPSNGTLVQQWNFNGGANQRMLFTPAPSGGNQISAQSATASCLDVPAQALNTNGTLFQVWTCLGASNQAFNFVRQ